MCPRLNTDAGEGFFLLVSIVLWGIVEKHSHPSLPHIKVWVQKFPRLNIEKEGYFKVLSLGFVGDCRCHSKGVQDR